MISCGILFHTSTMASFKESHWLSFSLAVHFAPGVPRCQNLLDSNLDCLVASDWAPVVEVISCLSTFQVLAWLCKL